MMDKIPHKKKITVGLGTIIAVAIYVTPHAQKTIKWYHKTVETRDLAKDNKKAIEDLQKCERDAHETITRLETLINVMRNRIDRLEYKIDEAP